MIKRDELVSYLQEYLVCDDFKDYAPNGLQIEGAATIQTLCTAVTASQAVIDKAAAMQADALLVHHGYFWRGETPQITGTKYKRISQLISNNMNLLAYHLPLDCHPTLGNNACLGKLFDLDIIRMHPAGQIPNLLWSGVLNKSISAKAFSGLIEKKLKREPLHVAGINKPIHRIAWCSGAAEDYIEEASQLGVDAYLSGEISERTFYQAKELGLHYFACGHHATERLGIQALGEHLSERYGLSHQFIDSENPV